VSNWAKPRRASRHNVLYWSAGDYAGFGAGAHGHESGRRYWRKRLPREYVDDVGRGASTEAGSERLTPEQRAREAMTLGLRLVSGVDESAFYDRFPADRAEVEAVADTLCAQGWLVRGDGWLRVSSAGTFVANDILCRFL
jgi:oxygen-independent coproporphyrinogen-3 oxidase